MRILILEDEEGIAGFLKQGLTEENYEVDLVSNGITGLEKAFQNNYDLLLIDWMLPGKSGLEVCKQFRATDFQTPVIFLTAKDTVEDTISGLRAGANDYIKKPFSFEELLARINVQLRPYPEKQALLRLGPIELNRETYQVFKKGEELLLTQKEFNLLKYLIENKGRVCERSEIIEKVWDIHFDYNTGVIDVYINALRKKLAFQKGEEYIQTVRGVGYIAKDS